MQGHVSRGRYVIQSVARKCYCLSEYCELINAPPLFFAFALRRVCVHNVSAEEYGKGLNKLVTVFLARSSTLFVKFAWGKALTMLDK